MAIQKAVENDALGTPMQIHYTFGSYGKTRESRISLKHMEAIDTEAETAFTVSLETFDEAIKKTVAINDDPLLSAMGKAEKIRPIFEDLIRTLSGSWFVLDNFEDRILRRTEVLFAVPKLDPTHSAMAVEDMEIRTWWRALPFGERMKMSDRFDNSEKSKRIMIPLLRSPIALLDSEMKIIGDKWKEYRRAENPTESGFIDVANASIEWARRGVAQIAGMARVFMRLNDQEILKIIVSSPAEGRRLGYKVFGFSDRQVAEMYRYLEIIANKKAA